MEMVVDETGLASVQVTFGVVAIGCWNPLVVLGPVCSGNYLRRLEDLNKPNLAGTFPSVLGRVSGYSTNYSWADEIVNSVVPA